MVLEKPLARLLSRGADNRQVRSLSYPPVVIATELGNRAENQDRVAVVRMRSSRRRDKAILAVAISDGMGGMQDGGACASLTLAAFFEALRRQQTMPLPDRVHASALIANDRVHKFAHGRGGATLSAVVIEPPMPPSVVNVGDSRVYCDVFAPSGGRALSRLTVDNSLEEAFGAEGRDLLQFIGMGEGLRPHVSDVPNSANALFITTDGVHFLDSKLFEQLFLRSSNLRQAVDRLAALARWLGGPDNATIAAFALKEINEAPQEIEDGVLELWTPSESAEILLSPNVVEGPEPPETERKQTPRGRVSQKSGPRSSRARNANQTDKREKRDKADQHEQLKIEVEVGNGDLLNVDRGEV